MHTNIKRLLFKIGGIVGIRYKISVAFVRIDTSRKDA